VTCSHPIPSDLICFSSFIFGNKLTHNSVAFAASAYILQQIPNSLPPRLASKISAQLADLDYVHTNSARISSAVRTVLRLPADNLRVRLDESVKDLGKRREETAKVKGESERAVRYFRDLAGESQVQKNTVEGVDLDTPPQGMH
jgi:mitofusin